MCKIFHTVLSLLILLVLPASIFAGEKKINTRLKTERISTKDKAEKKTDDEMTAGSFMVASQCADCNKGYTLDQIVMSGYDKPLTSAQETFFITNNTDRILSGLTLYVEYLTLDGRQLDKRFIKLSCAVPPGETRIAKIPSWDTQKSFFYEKSARPKRQATPYKVVFDPVAYYLRF